ncbi:MAG: hypothetical protein K9L70_07440 [Thiohalocapsa sp.]|nr:hypothetical protein [Thiohalocapsa sp.]MCF7990540.1 hypothetical protein [Thiohalocapsa sp.]
MPRALLPLAAVIALTLLLPLLGAVAGGQPLSELLRLPMTARAWDPAPPNAAITLAASLAAALTVLAVLWLARPRHRAGRAVETRTPAPLPRYVWFALFALIAALIAVDGDAVNAACALITLAVALLANADTQRRTGNSLIRQRPGYFFSLFAASLAVGWMFYWLNLFLQLWTYPPAVEAVPFVLGKSFHYAVLLPALLSLRQWLASFEPVLRWTRAAAPMGGEPAPQEGWMLIGFAALALAAAPLWPDWLYPVALLAPLLLALGLQQVRARPTLLSGLAAGDWSRVLLPAAAALMLGVFAQACNWLLGPAWRFELPLIGGPELFGLPLAAYTWLFPLGLLGVWVGDQLTDPWKNRPQQPTYRPRFPVKISVTDLLGKRRR